MLIALPAVAALLVLFPLLVVAHDASDFFIFARAEFGLARNGNEQDCDGSNDKQADVSGSGNTIHGRIHSNADVAATSGGNTIFQHAITYGTTDTDCLEQSEDATNTYTGGQPQDIDTAPSGTTNGWPGDLASYLNADGLTFGTDISQVLPGETCDVGTLTDTGVREVNEANDGQVVCNGTGLTKLSAQNQNMSITIVSHGPIDISGQGAVLRPAAHSILTWTDYALDVSTKLAGSNLSVPARAILFAPSGGIDTSGSDDAALCIQLIGQGPIKVPGSNSTFGPGSEACVEVQEQSPIVSITKTNNSAATVTPGTAVGFTITVSVSHVAAADVIVVDTLPNGYDAPTAISNSGAYNASTRQITWDLGDLAVGSHQVTYTAAVSGDVPSGTQLVNVAVVTSPGSNCPAGSEDPACDDDSTVTVLVPPLTPLLVVDKVANVTTITIGGTTAAPTATPSSITWTLSYTLTNGPVTDAVITDPLPAGLNFVSATNGGTFNATTRTITWNLANPLTTSGSVSFVTSVDPATISRSGPTVNIATIDSTQTNPDTGQDDVAVTVEQTQASTGGPGTSTTARSSSLPNTALEIGPLGAMTIPLVAVALVLLGSLGALGYANVRSVRRRQR